MALHTHLVVVYNHETGELSYDEDGTQFWIRSLFTPETSTWADDEEDYIEVPVETEIEALEALAKLGVGKVNW